MKGNPEHDVIYIVQAGDAGPVLIGHVRSRGWKRRLDTLQAANHETLHVRDLIDGDERLERRLHVTLEQHHRRGDWYEAAVLTDVPDDLPRVPVDPDAERRRVAMTEIDDLLRAVREAEASS